VKYDSLHLYGSHPVVLITKETHSLHRVKEVKWTKANWVGHILRRNCLLKYIIEGKIEGRIEVTGR